LIIGDGAFLALLVLLLWLVYLPSIWCITIVGDDWSAFLGILRLARFADDMSDVTVPSLSRETVADA